MAKPSLSIIGNSFEFHAGKVEASGTIDTTANSITVTDATLHLPTGDVSLLTQPLTVENPAVPHLADYFFHL